VQFVNDPNLWKILSTYKAMKSYLATKTPA
jgi:hypothetical protein